MTLFLDCSLYSGVTKLLNVSKSPYSEFLLDNIDFELFDLQGFSSRADRVVFDLDFGDFWLELCVAEQVNIGVETDRAIFVPFEVTEVKPIKILDDGRERRVSLETGTYKLLFEHRHISLEEVRSVEKYAVFYDYTQMVLEGNATDEIDDTELPELCRLSFIPTSETVKPELLKFTPWGRQLRRGTNDPDYRQLSTEELAFRNRRLVMRE